jgi:hypothetical protein
MVAGVSEPSETAYGTIVVVGGGCYGSYYVTQLLRARAAGAITVERIVAVDRDPACRVSTMRADPIVSLRIAEWTPFFDEYLAAAVEAKVETAVETTAPALDVTTHVAAPRDAIVPSPLMPHLMYEWLMRRARARWPDRVVETRPLPAAPDTPWRSVAPDGTDYVSYATWMCPINCVEPRRCPHTRGERSWTMPAAARDLVARTRESATPLQGPVIFHCTHRAYGVGMFDTRDVVAGDAAVADAAARQGADLLVGTVSHCHGALNVLHVGDATSASVPGKIGESPTAQSLAARPGS